MAKCSPIQTRRNPEQIFSVKKHAHTVKTFYRESGSIHIVLTNSLAINSKKFHVKTVLCFSIFKDSKSKKISLTSVNIFWNERKFKVKLLDNNAKQEQIEGNTKKETIQANYRRRLLHFLVTAHVSQLSEDFLLF